MSHLRALVVLLVLVVGLVAFAPPSVAQDAKKCRLCGNEIAGKSYSASKGPACQECWWRCTKCAMRVAPDQASPYWGGLTRLCKSCYERCDSCGSLMRPPIQARTCEDCRSACTVCKNRIYDSQPRHQTERGLQCDDCWSKSVRRCDGCGKALDKEFVYYFSPGLSKFACGGCRATLASKPGWGDVQERQEKTDAPAETRTPAKAPPEVAAKSKNKVWVLGGILVIVGGAVAFLLTRRTD